MSWVIGPLTDVVIARLASLASPGVRVLDTWTVAGWCAPLDPVGPFDHGHRTGIEQVLDAAVGQEPGELARQVRVGMPQRHPARVFDDQQVGRTRDGGRFVDAEPLGEAARQRGLAGAEFTHQRHGVTRVEAPADRSSELLGLPGIGRPASRADHPAVTSTRNEVGYSESA